MTSTERQARQLVVSYHDKNSASVLELLRDSKSISLDLDCGDAESSGQYLTYWESTTRKMLYLSELEEIRIVGGLLEKISVTVLENIFCNLHRIRKVKITGEVGQDNLDIAGKGLWRYPSLECVEINGRIVHTDNPFFLLQKLGHNPKITLYSIASTDVTEYEAHQIANKKKNTWPDLHSLSIRGCMRENGVEDILIDAIASCPFYTSNLKGVLFRDGTSKAELAELLSTPGTLQRIELQQWATPQNENFERQLLTALSSNSSLVELELNGLSPLASQYFEISLKEGLQSLKHLKLVCKRNFSDDKMSSLLQAIGTHACIQHLFIENIEQHQSLVLASSLARNTHLLTLVLHYGRRRVTYASYVAFLRMIFGNVTLRALQFMISKRCMRMTEHPRSWSNFQSALKENYGLHQFVIPTHATNHEIYSWQECAYTNIPLQVHLCHMNHAGRKYVLEDPSNRGKAVKVLDAVIDDLDSLYFHLSENPAACDLGPEYLQSPRTAGRKRVLGGNLKLR